MVASGHTAKRPSHTDLSDLAALESAVPSSPAVKPVVAKKKKKSSSKEKKSSKGDKASIHDLGKILEPRAVGTDALVHANRMSEARAS